MKRYLPLVVVGLIVTALAACQTGGAGLSDQDKTAIRKLDDDFIKAVTAEKPDWDTALAAYYAEDAKWMMSNMPAAEGRAAIKTAFSAWPPIKEFKLTEVSLDGAGDLAYRHYAYVMTTAVPGAPGAVIDKGKGIEVFKRQADGTWRVIRDVGNSDLPAPGLTIPTGAMATDASPEIKKLGDLVGRWQIDGKFQVDPKKPAEPLAMGLDCQWFAGGRQVVCLYSGTIAGAPLQETSTYSYNVATKSHEVYNVQSFGATLPGKVTIQPSTWTHLFDTRADGKPAKQRLTLTNMSSAGGDWKEEISVAGGAWTPTGGGKYAKAK
jgi:ketosteroid isomerase-like protein